jgi:hypothetical protein
MASGRHCVFALANPGTKGGEKWMASEDGHCLRTPDHRSNARSLTISNMARSKVWLPLHEHCDGRVKLRTGDDVTLRVSYSDGRVSVLSWGAGTTIHGRLLGIEWHEMGEGLPGPGVRVSDTDDFTHDVDDYAYELTIATRDPLPHG